jgi:hypothetical protein
MYRIFKLVSLKKLLIISVVVFLNAGCAITDYPLICDVDQTDASTGRHVVSIPGKALIVPNGVVATIWPDGTDQLLTFVRQRSNGDQTLLTYNNFCASGAPCDNGNDIFAGMQYLNPDTSGCWLVRAPNPFNGEDDIFDNQINFNCKQGRGSRSLTVLFAADERFLEAGKDGNAGHSDNPLDSQCPIQPAVPPTPPPTPTPPPGAVAIPLSSSPTTLLSAVNQMNAVCEAGDFTAEYGLVGFKCTLTPEIFQANIGGTTDINVDGLVVVANPFKGQFVVDARTGNVSDILNQFAEYADSNSSNEGTTITINTVGITKTYNVKLLDGDYYRAMIEERLN